MKTEYVGRSSIKRQSLFLSLNHVTVLVLKQFEADRRAFMITINSFGTEMMKEERAKLFPTCGKLFPDGLVALSRAEDYDQVRIVAEFYGVCFRSFYGIFTHLFNKIQLFLRFAKGQQCTHNHMAEPRWCWAIVCSASSRFLNSNCLGEEARTHHAVCTTVQALSIRLQFPTVR